MSMSTRCRGRAVAVLAAIFTPVLITRLVVPRRADAAR